MHIFFPLVYPPHLCGLSSNEDFAPVFSVLLCNFLACSSFVLHHAIFLTRSLDFSHTLLIVTNYTALGIGIMYSGMHFQCNTWMWFQELMNSILKQPPKAQSAWKFTLNKIGTFFGCIFVNVWPWTLQQNRYVTVNRIRVTQSVMRVLYLFFSSQSSYTVSFHVIISYFHHVLSIAVMPSLFCYMFETCFGILSSFIFKKWPYHCVIYLFMFQVIYV
jgi:hypothetical protein